LEIIAHRGFWNKPDEKNSIKSFNKALSFGFGIETDIRDLNGEIIISHDPPHKNSDFYTFSSFLDLYKKYNSNNTLALNIKSDGLAPNLKNILDKYQIKDYFFFDMSVPDYFSFRDLNLTTFCRSSEFENAELLRKNSEGVWIDAFSIKNFNSISFKKFFSDWDSIAFVSPELHKYEFLEFWERLKKTSQLIPNKKVFLCTDYPNQANEFFN